MLCFLLMVLDLAVSPSCSSGTSEDNSFPDCSASASNSSLTASDFATFLILPPVSLAAVRLGGTYLSTSLFDFGVASEVFSPSVFLGAFS